MSVHDSWMKRTLPLVVCDTLALIAAYYGTYYLRFESDLGRQFFGWFGTAIGLGGAANPGDILERYYWEQSSRLLVTLFATLLFLYAFFDLYAGHRFIRRAMMLRGLVLANITALVLFYIYFYITRNAFHPRSMFVSMLAINVVLSALLRSGSGRIARHFGWRSCPAVLVGDTPEAAWIAARLEAEHPHGVHVAKRVPYNPAESSKALLDAIADAVRRNDAGVVIAADRRMPIGAIMQLLALTDNTVVATKVLTDRMNVLINEAGMRMDMIHGLPLVHFDPVGKRRLYYVAKRGLSVLLALLLLVLLSPVLALIAILTRLSSPGPVLFVQERIGFNRVPFRMFKFRTMYADAEQRQAEIEQLNEAQGGLFKIRNDPRVTPVGRWLRRLSLDELPQLWNVARGDMTLVGPRPLPRRDLEQYFEKWHYSRHGGLPGITCLWQVSGRSEINFHNMCLLDIYYLRNQSLMLDLKILIQTIGVVLFARGAY